MVWSDEKEAEMIKFVENKFDLTFCKAITYTSSQEQPRWMEFADKRQNSVLFYFNGEELWGPWITRENQPIWKLE